jgi:hypothetical protein
VKESFSKCELTGLGIEKYFYGNIQAMHPISKPTYEEISFNGYRHNGYHYCVCSGKKIETGSTTTTKSDP